MPEPVSNNVSRTYFHGFVEWHPQRSTRVIRVLYDSSGEPSSLQLCESSDNNHTVLIGQPFDRQVLIEAVRTEIGLVVIRQQLRHARLVSASIGQSSSDQAGGDQRR